MNLKDLMFKNWGTLRELPAIINCMIEESTVRVTIHISPLRVRAQSIYLGVCITVCRGRNENTDQKIPLGNTFLESSSWGWGEERMVCIEWGAGFSVHEVKRIGLNSNES